MAALSFYVGVIGNVISVLMFLAPVNTFWRIVENRSTEEFESLPYVCTLLNAALWTYYGIIKPGAYLVATVNGFGILVELVYVSLFLIYASPKMKVKTGITIALLDVGFLVAAVLVTRLALVGDVRINATGFICAGLNIIMYASPLAAMKTVVTTKSVEFMPFLLSFFFFLNGAIWTFYAFLTADVFLGVPNGVGFVLGIAQIVLYLIYCRNGKRYNRNLINDDVLEQGWQYDTLFSPPSSSSSQPFHHQLLK
ncbi:bidirectional sugar transporter SWEET17 [Euphorbia lathyris]|uniref:bidirectional sugar transporter SWEET17 n=1 Tax=Euphorbia lathyris TaxID=212925 RepID=UPI003313E03F